jgi:hypothetical protein
MSAPTPRPPILQSRSVFATVLDVVARLGTAVTLAALLVVVGCVLATVDSEPAPTGVAVPSR